MQVVQTLADLRRARVTLTGTLGLVPTMGALHDGHLALVARARAENDCVAASIFVNPTQFGPQEDLSTYPRPRERDLALLREHGVNLVWTPTPDDVYPPGFQTWIEVEDVSRPLEGSHRPGHFRGVATVVAKLFNAFTPDRAYFGQKDAQQVAVIRQMARDLNFPMEIVVCPTVLYRALSAAAARYDAGEREGAVLRAAMQMVLAAEPLARPDYVSAADPDTLQELEHVAGGVLLSLAVRIGQTRLIDNLLLGADA